MSLNDLAQKRIEELLINCAQILDAVKVEWRAANCWSEWDESVRTGITEQLALFKKWDADNLS